MTLDPSPLCFLRSHLCAPAAGFGIFASSFRTSLSLVCLALRQHSLRFRISPQAGTCSRSAVLPLKPKRTVSICFLRTNQRSFVKFALNLLELTSFYPNFYIRILPCAISSQRCVLKNIYRCRFSTIYFSNTSSELASWLVLPQAAKAAPLPAVPPLKSKHTVSICCALRRFEKFASLRSSSSSQKVRFAGAFWEPCKT